MAATEQLVRRTGYATAADEDGSAAPRLLPVRIPTGFESPSASRAEPALQDVHPVGMRRKAMRPPLPQTLAGIAIATATLAIIGACVLGGLVAMAFTRAHPSGSPSAPTPKPTAPYNSDDFVSNTLQSYHFKSRQIGSTHFERSMRLFAPVFSGVDDPNRSQAVFQLGNYYYGVTSITLAPGYQTNGTTSFVGIAGAPHTHGYFDTIYLGSGGSFLSGVDAREPTVLAAAAALRAGTADEKFLFSRVFVDRTGHHDAVRLSQADACALVARTAGLEAPLACSEVDHDAVAFVMLQQLNDARARLSEAERQLSDLLLQLDMAEAHAA